MSIDYKDVSYVFEGVIPPLGYMTFWSANCENSMRTLLAVCCEDWEIVQIYAAVTDETEYALNPDAFDKRLEAFKQRENAMAGHLTKLNKRQLKRKLTERSSISDDGSLVKWLNSVASRYASARNKRHRFIHDAYEVFVYSNNEDLAVGPGRTGVKWNKREQQYVKHSASIGPGELEELAQIFCELCNEIWSLIQEALIRRQIHKD